MHGACLYELSISCTMNDILPLQALDLIQYPNKRLTWSIANVTPPS